MSPIAAGAIPAVVHHIGDFLPDSVNFLVPARKVTRLPGVHLRIGPLTRTKVIPTNGLPIPTVERTIADLTEPETGLSLVAGAVRDAIRTVALVAPDRLVACLTAQRTEHR